MAAEPTPTAGPPPIPSDVVDRVLLRLGHWESSVETPEWTIPYQQLRMPPQGPTEFTHHRDSPEQIVRFRDCQPERQFWLDLLPNIDPNIRRIERFRSCGRWCFVARDLETGRLFLRGEACKLRICPACRRRIQHRSAARVLDFMAARPDEAWQFHTFTLRHGMSELSNQLDRLVTCFRKLRHRKTWRRNVRCGYAIIETTYHPKGTWSPSGRQREHDEWHPHLHVIAATSFIDWGWLHEAWLSITGDSHDVDCSLVESPTHAAHYIAKYVGKPADLNLRAQPERAAEYFHAIANRRLLMPFGDTTKHTLPPPPPPPPTELVCRYADLRIAADRGSYPARCMLTNLLLATVPQLRRRPDHQDLLFQDRPP